MDSIAFCSSARDMHAPVPRAVSIMGAGTTLMLPLWERELGFAFLQEERRKLMRVPWSNEKLSECRNYILLCIPRGISAYDLMHHRKELFIRSDYAGAYLEAAPHESGYVLLNPTPQRKDTKVHCEECPASFHTVVCAMALGLLAGKQLFDQPLTTIDLAGRQVATLKYIANRIAIYPPQAPHWEVRQRAPQLN